MTRPARIMLEMFGPPLLGAATLTIVAVVGTRDLAVLALFPFFLVFGYVSAGLPSFVFAAIMELAFSMGLRPDGLRAVALAAVLGTVAGLPTDMVMAGSVTVRPNAACFMVLGFLVGGAIGLRIRARSRPVDQQ